MKSTPRWIRKRMSPAATAGSDVPLRVARHDGPDLRVGQRLEDGLHVRDLAPHVQAATVGHPHDELATATGVAFDVVPAFERLLDRRLVEFLFGPCDRGEDEVGDVVDGSECPLDERRIGVRALAVLRQAVVGLGVAVVRLVGRFLLWLVGGLLGRRFLGCSSPVCRRRMPRATSANTTTTLMACSRFMSLSHPARVPRSVGSLTLSGGDAPPRSLDVRAPPRRPDSDACVHVGGARPP